jgi:hypothetical protein
MSIETSTQRSRRAILAAAFGAGVAAIASAVARPEPARATNGDAVLVGGTFNGTSVTTIQNLTNAATALAGSSGSSGIGVGGNSDSGPGVQGNSGTGFGVSGVSSTGVGVAGDGSTSGTGVWATASVSGGGIALQVDGKVKFSRSGRTTMAAGTSSKTVSLPGITTGSLVFAVLGSNRSGRWVRAVVPATGSFKIYLNTTVPSSTYVSWFILN